jgi:hypothetical protein
MLVGLIEVFNLLAPLVLALNNTFLSAWSFFGDNWFLPETNSVKAHYWKFSTMEMLLYSNPIWA